MENRSEQLPDGISTVAAATAGSPSALLAGVAGLSRDELRFVWEQLAQAQRHADDLLNARLQGFVVSTSVLMAAFSQFRDKQYSFIAEAICIFGMVLAYVMYRALTPTARLSRWCIDVLRELDALVFPKNLRPYVIRDRLDQQVFGPKGAVLELTARTFPLAAIVLWIVLAMLYLAANYWFKIPL
jgi:hypothetical protein